MASTSETIRIALLGFSDFERNALKSCLSLAEGRWPRYRHELDIDDADLVIADADDGGVVELLTQLGRLGDSVFVGAQVPADAAGWLMHPINPRNVLRELDALVYRRRDGGHSASGPLTDAGALDPLQRLAGPSGFGPVGGPIGGGFAGLSDTGRRATDRRGGRSAPGAPDATWSLADDEILRELGAQEDSAGTPYAWSEPWDERERGASRSASLPPLEADPPLTGGDVPPWLSGSHAPGADPRTRWTPRPAGPALTAQAPPRPTGAQRLPDLTLPDVAHPPQSAATSAPAPKAMPDRQRQRLAGTQGRHPGHPSELHPRRVAVAQAPVSPGRALVVDDSELARVFLGRELAAYGIEVDSAAGSDEALALLNERAYRFAFLDIELGHDSPLDGFGLCHQIRHLAAPHGERPPAVVMVSAHHDAVDVVRGTLAGAEAHLAKPLDRPALEQWMQRHGLSRGPTGEASRLERGAARVAPAPDCAGLRGGEPAPG